MSGTQALGIGKDVSLPFQEVLERVEARLAEQGFGILTRIDVKKTLEEKLGVDVAPFVILGSCNPPIAHRALEAKPEVSLLMPCNVVVRRLEDGKVRVEAMNPAMMATMFPGTTELEAIAAEARERIEKAIAAV
jgi:uncharacterized protein (DUF302 family)